MLGLRASFNHLGTLVLLGLEPVVHIRLPPWQIVLSKVFSDGGRHVIAKTAVAWRPRGLGAALPPRTALLDHERL